MTKDLIGDTVYLRIVDDELLKPAHSIKCTVVHVDYHYVILADIYGT